jgi:peptidoglycan glycosyltransferase
VNRPLSRVAAAVGIMLLLLVINLNYVQVVKGSEYRADPANRRVLLDEYSRQRGSIVVGGTPIAASVKTDDRLKYLRQYASGPMYAAVTGYYSLFYGRSGLEDADNSVLSGSDDRLFVDRVAELFTGRDPRGGNVILTINKAAQEAAYTALAGRRGAVVAIDPSTGAILAAVSSPSYDPSTLSSHDADSIQSAYKSLLADPNSPMLDRALNQTYPPGSVFKVVVAAAAIKNGTKPDTRIAAPDSITLPQTTTTLANYDNERCGDGKTDTLDHALTISCNTAFAQLGMDLGVEAIRAEAAKFGIDAGDLTVPLPVAKSSLGPIIDQASLAQSSIGQRDVRITPLQAAMIAAAVSNNGVLMKPYLVQEEQAPNLSSLAVAKPEVLNTVMDSDQAALLKAMMVNVVNKGTGTAAKIPGVVVGGKTGTADNVPGAQPHAWFIGFAPSDNPKIAVAVVLENAGVAGNETTGGLAAAPVAQAVIKAVLGK